MFGHELNGLVMNAECCSFSLVFEESLDCSFALLFFLLDFEFLLQQIKNELVLLLLLFEVLIIDLLL